LDGQCLPLRYRVLGQEVGGIGIGDGKAETAQDIGVAAALNIDGGGGIGAGQDHLSTAVHRRRNGGGAAADRRRDLGRRLSGRERNGHAVDHEIAAAGPNDVAGRIDAAGEARGSVRRQRRVDADDGGRLRRDGERVGNEIDGIEQVGAWRCPTGIGSGWVDWQIGPVIDERGLLGRQEAVLKLQQAWQAAVLSIGTPIK
jgi:hypothetical protein